MHNQGDNKTMELLRKLYDVTSRLDSAYCTLLHRGESDMTGEEYESLEDVIMEVEEFLEESDKNDIVTFAKINGYEIIYVDLKSGDSYSFNPLQDTLDGDMKNKNVYSLVINVKELGFDDEHDFILSVSSIDLSDPERRKKFELWREFDGTKDGLKDI